MRLERKSWRRMVLLGLGLAGLFSTQVLAFDVVQTGVALAPMPHPLSRAVGDRWVQLRNDVETVETRLISATYATHTFENTDKCVVTRRKGTRFTPYISWICPSGNGSNTVTNNGSPWPLELGKQWSYAVNGKDGDGAQWSYDLDCQATDTATVVSALGTNDTYVVTCSHKWGTQTVYIAPSLGEQVYFILEEGEKSVTYEVVEIDKSHRDP